MTSEHDFYAAMDAEPENHLLRSIFADWLDERNDPTAAGWRALWVGGYMARWFSGAKNWGFWTDAFVIPRRYPVPETRFIPDDWFRLVERSRHVLASNRNSVLHTPDNNPRYGPRVLLKALAVAKLPPERQAELLRLASSTANA